MKKLVSLLEDICGEKLDVFEERRVRALISTMGGLRNDFLHGDWAAVEARMTGVNIRSCFEVVAHVLYSLEGKCEERRRGAYTKLA